MTTKTLQALVQNQIQSSAKLSQRSLKDFRDPETSVAIYKRREKTMQAANPDAWPALVSVR